MSTDAAAMLMYFLSTRALMTKIEEQNAYIDASSKNGSFHTQCELTKIALENSHFYVDGSTIIMW